MLKLETSPNAAPNQIAHSTCPDRRLSAKFAEKLVILFNPYKYSGLEHLPANPPYIIAANHNVLRGDYTRMPYDGFVINDFLRKTRNVSPHWLIKLKTEELAENIGEFDKYSIPYFRDFIKFLFDSTGRCIYLDPKNPINRVALQEMIFSLDKLRLLDCVRREKTILKRYRQV